MRASRVSLGAFFGPKAVLHCLQRSRVGWRGTHRLAHLARRFALLAVLEVDGRRFRRGQFGAEILAWSRPRGSMLPLP